MKKEVIKPSKIFYGVSGVILVIGVILFVIILISGIFASVDTINNRFIVLGILFISFGAAITIFIVTLVKRKKAKSSILVQQETLH